MAEPIRRNAPTQSVEETALSRRVDTTTELAPSAAEAAAQHEVQGAIILARRFPRDEDQAYQALIRSCQRTTFAEGASYSFPRGGTTVEGPSVKLAREAARLWGNILVRLEVLRDDEESRHIRAVAWDLQTNARHAAEDQFQKLIYRKGKGGADGRWVKPDERDLRELTNRRGAILERNCILKLLPPDLIDDARTQAGATLEKNAAQDPDGERKRVLRAFSEINITAEMLERYLGHKISESSPAEIADLRKIYASIRDGNSTWSEYVTTEKKEPEKGTLDLGAVKGKDLPPRDEQKAAEPSEPASVADLEDLRERARKRGIGIDQLNDECLKVTGKVLAELTHGECNTMTIALAKKK